MEHMMQGGELGGTNDRDTAPRAKHGERAFAEQLYVEGTEAGIEKMLGQYRGLQEQVTKLQADLDRSVDEAMKNPARRELLTKIGRLITADLEAAKKERDELGNRILEMGGTLETMQ